MEFSQYLDFSLLSRTLLNISGSWLRSCSSTLSWISSSWSSFVSGLVILLLLNSSKTSLSTFSPYSSSLSLFFLSQSSSSILSLGLSFERYRLSLFSIKCVSLHESVNPSLLIAQSPHNTSLFSSHHLIVLHAVPHLSAVRTYLFCSQ